MVLRRLRSLLGAVRTLRPSDFQFLLFLSFFLLDPIETHLLSVELVLQVQGQLHLFGLEELLLEEGNLVDL